jgi:hypothetical protein
MGHDSDTKRLRMSDADAANERTRQPEPTLAGAPSLLVRTTTITTYPTTAAVYYGCIPQTVSGTQTEGTAGSTATAVGAFLALNLGSAVPPVSTLILATFVPHRWVFRYDG